MERGLAVVLAVSCLLAQAGVSDAGRRRRQPSADAWAWADNSADEDVALGRLLHYSGAPRPRPAAGDASLLAALNDVLSAACCKPGRAFDLGSKTCRKLAPESDPLMGRSGVTGLPPNCPPPTKYDPESKRCRDVWD